MVRRRRWLPAIAFLALPSACSHTDVTRDESVSGIWSAVDQAQAESDRHSAVCPLVVGPMPGMNQELERHQSSMFDAIDRIVLLSDRMAVSPAMGMQSCSGPSFEQMSGVLGDMSSAVAAHGVRMRAAQTPSAARAECSAYSAQVDAMLRLIEGDLKAMPCMGTAGDYALNPAALP